MSDEEMKAELERLRAENDRLKQRGSRSTSLKVSEKGGVSVYGLGRFPVTLYKEQWLKILEMADVIDMLEVKGAAFAFPEVCRQVREDMKQVQSRLNVGDVGTATQAIQQDIVESLRDILDSLRPRC